MSFVDLAVETGLEPGNSAYYYDIILEKPGENINSGEITNAFAIPLPTTAKENLVI